MTKQDTQFVITANKGFHIKFANGWAVSVQWGTGNYCDNRDNIAVEYGSAVPASCTAETAVLDPEGNFVLRSEGDYDTVQAYQTPEQVVATMAWAAAK